MARFMMSAAEPWIGALIAAARHRRVSAGLPLLISGVTQQAAEQGGDVALVARLRLGPLHVVLDPRILLEIGLDVALGLVVRDAEALGQAEGADAVDDAVVDHLGVAPERRVDPSIGHLEHLGSGDRVDVDIAWRTPP